MMPLMITIEDFAKIELRVGTVLEATEVVGSEKLIKLTVDIGEETPRTVLTGMKKWYKPEYFLKKQIVIVSNLAPRQMMGFESHGMIVACDSGLGNAKNDNKPILLKPSKKVPNGSKIR